MKRQYKTWMCMAIACCAAMMISCSGQADNQQKELMTVGNPYLPLWEHIPDGEPYVFEDPDNPGQFRVYIYGISAGLHAYRGKIRSMERNFTVVRNIHCFRTPHPSAAHVRLRQRLWHLEQ